MKIGYIVRKFPVLSQTFILNEMLELEAQGVDLHIFSIEKSNTPRYHKNLHKLRATVTYLPDLLEWKTLLNHRKKIARLFPQGFRKALGYTIKQCNASFGFRLLQACSLAYTAQKMGITHFHAHFATRATTVAFLTSMIMNIPYSLTAHAVDIFSDRVSPKALQKKLSSAAFVITVSEYNKRFLSQNFATPHTTIHRVYNGIDLSLFNPKPNSSSDPFTFLCVARLVEKKGHDTLLEACRILKERHVPFQCKLIGAGPLQKEIEKKIDQGKLHDMVQLLGPQTQEEVLRHFHESHCYVLTCKTGSNGDQDGLPVAMVEALACGIPVITTPMTGNPEVIRNEYNGLLVPFEEPSAVAAAMEKMVRQRSFYDALCKNTRESVEQQFDIRQTTAQLSQYFCSTHKGAKT